MVQSPYDKRHIERTSNSPQPTYYGRAEGNRASPQSHPTGRRQGVRSGVEQANYNIQRGRDAQRPASSRDQSMQGTSSRRDNHPETTMHDEAALSLPTFITTIATTIAMVISQVERWKEPPFATKKGHAVVPSEELEQLLETVSATSFWIAQLQHRYPEPSGGYASGHHQPQAGSSQTSEKDRAITSLTAEVTRNARDITALREDNMRLRHNLSTSAAREDELRQRCGTVTSELSLLCGDLRTKTLSVEQMNRTIASFTAQIAQWSTSDGPDTQHIIDSLSDELAQVKHENSVTADQLATAHRDVRHLRTELFSAKSKVAEMQQRCEAHSQELNSVQLRRALAEKNKRIEQLDRELAASTSRHTELQKSYEALSSDLGDARNESKSGLLARQSGTRHPHPGHTSPRSFNGGKDDTTGTLNAEIEQLRRENAAKTKELESANAQRRQLQLRVEELNGKLERRDNEELRGELAPVKENSRSQAMEMQQRYEKQSRELEEHQSQLAVLQRFTTTADLHTDISIIQMLQKLNAEVQQSTTFIAESILERLGRVKKITAERTSATQRASKCVGQKLVGCLSGDDVALYLPIAFQAFLAYHLCGIISSWTNDKGNSDFIRAVYKQLREKETQMISGNWRTLTHAYISQTSPSDLRSHVSSTLVGFSDIIVAAGYATSTATAESALFRFKDKVSSMITIAGQLNRMIGEVVSSDFEVFVVQPYQMFEETTMEEDTDDYSQREGPPQRTKAGQRVLCSTYLGLTKGEPVRSGGRNMLTAMKAKVLVESFLEGA